MKKYILMFAVLTLAGACSTLPDRGVADRQSSLNQSGTDKNGADAERSMDHKSTFFVARKGVEDGHVFIFHVMPAPEGERFSRVNYHLMVSVEKNGRPLTNLKLYSDVKHPDGSFKKKALMMQMGNWYMASYNLSHEQGRHWLTVSFEASGKTYTSGIYYPERVVR